MWHLTNFMTVPYGLLGFDTMYISWNMLRNADTVNNSWFQTFTMLWMLYAFFWVIPWRMNFMPTFGNTLSVPSSWRWNRQSVPKRWHMKFRCQGITQKRAYNLLNNVKTYDIQIINSSWHSHAHPLQATACTSMWLHPLQLTSAVHVASSRFCITLHILEESNGITDNHLH